MTVYRRSTPDSFTLNAYPWRGLAIHRTARRSEEYLADPMRRMKPSGRIGRYGAIPRAEIARLDLQGRQELWRGLPRRRPLGSLFRCIRCGRGIPNIVNGRRADDPPPGALFTGRRETLQLDPCTRHSSDFHTAGRADDSFRGRLAIRQERQEVRVDRGPRSDVRVPLDMLCGKLALQPNMIPNQPQFFRRLVPSQDLLTFRPSGYSPPYTSSTSPCCSSTRSTVSVWVKPNPPACSSHENAFTGLIIG